MSNGDESDAKVCENSLSFWESPQIWSNSADNRKIKEMYDPTFEKLDAPPYTRTKDQSDSRLNKYNFEIQSSQPYGEEVRLACKQGYKLAYEWDGMRIRCNEAKKIYEPVDNPAGYINRCIHMKMCSIGAFKREWRDKGYKIRSAIRTPGLEKYTDTFFYEPCATATHDAGYEQCTRKDGSELPIKLESAIELKCELGYKQLTSDENVHDKPMAFCSVRGAGEGSTMKPRATWGKGNDVLTYGQLYPKCAPFFSRMFVDHIFMLLDHVSYISYIIIINCITNITMYKQY